MTFLRLWDSGTYAAANALAAERSSREAAERSGVRLHFLAHQLCDWNASMKRLVVRLTAMSGLSALGVFGAAQAHRSFAPSATEQIDASAPPRLARNQMPQPIGGAANPLREAAPSDPFSRAASQRAEEPATNPAAESAASQYLSLIHI